MKILGMAIPLLIGLLLVMPVVMPTLMWAAHDGT
jgi:hypothetical protein